MDRHLHPDELVDLANGLMAEPARMSALEHLRACTACAHQLRHAVADREHARAAGPPRRVNGQWVRADAATLPAERPAMPAAPAVAGPAPGPTAAGASVRARLSGRAWVGAAGAAALLGLIAMALRLWPLRSGGDSADASGWLPLQTEAVLRRGPWGPPPADALEPALRAYAAHDAAQAAKLLSSAQVPAAYEPLRVLYLASALEIDARPMEAMTALDGLKLEAMPQPWRDQARWVRYRALRALGRAEEAADLLRQLQSADGLIGDWARAEHERRPAR